MTRRVSSCIQRKFMQIYLVISTKKLVIEVRERGEDGREDSLSNYDFDELKKYFIRLIEI